MRTVPKSSSPRSARGGQGAPGEREVHSISALPPSAREDRDRRLGRYLVSMTTRTVCFVVAVVVTMVDGPAWIAWACVVAAVVLPYPAVVAANNINRRREVVPTRRHTPRELTGHPVEGLTPGHGPVDGDGTGAHRTWPGESDDADDPRASSWP